MSIMTRKEELQKQIKEYEAMLVPLKAELREIDKNEVKEIERRCEVAAQGKGDFTLDELRFAAYTRCNCGAGMAYPKGTGIRGYWECSDILRGKASTEVKHSASMPFAFYEIKSEDQPSANGSTTRPKE